MVILLMQNWYTEKLKKKCPSDVPQAGSLGEDSKLQAHRNYSRAWSTQSWGMEEHEANLAVLLGIGSNTKSVSSYFLVALRRHGMLPPTLESGTVHIRQVVCSFPMAAFFEDACSIVDFRVQVQKGKDGGGLSLQQDDMKLNDSQFREPHTGILYTPPKSLGSAPERCWTFLLSSSRRRPQVFGPRASLCLFPRRVLGCLQSKT